MKRLGLVLAVLSLNAFAGNPQLDEILKKHEATLSKIEVGMTSDEISTGSIITFSDSNAQVESRNTDTFSVIVKKVGTSAYIYRLVRNLKTGRVTRYVELEDYNLTSEEVPADLVFTVNDDILSASVNGEIEDELGTYSYIENFSKDLKSSIFCNAKSEINDSFTIKSTNKVLKAKSTTVTQCGKNMSKEEVKAIELNNIDFCQKDENGDSSCEKRDMSFLTANL